MATRRRRVAVLGGGMAGLAAAWALSDADARDELEVTVLEAAPHLGGKGASTRGAHGRIEEHGLHVWLGYYDNAFRLMREVYDELDRPATDPACPLATWRDAFTPADLVGVEERRDGAWSHWVAAFARNDQEPGAPGTAPASADPLPVATFVRRGLGLLLDFTDSVRKPGAVVLSGSPEPPRPPPAAAFADLLRRAEVAALVGAVEGLRLLRAGAEPGGPAAGAIVGYLDRLRAELAGRLEREEGGRRSAALADLVATTLQGTIRDGLLTRPSGFAAIDHLDFREWLAGHGARPATIDSALVRGMYDLVFAYEEGDPARPRFPAGLGLFLAGKLFFEYRGSIFWRMEAGMGDVVFVPLHQALLGRGVRIALGHRVERLRLSADRRRIAAIDVRREHDAGDDPFLRVRGVPCYRGAPALRPAAGERAALRSGADFDDVVLATSVAPLRATCAELVADDPRWRAMVDGIGTVPTQAVQLWLRDDEAALGWPYPGATVSGYVTPFDTYASMSHLAGREDWPASERPRSIAYLCSALRDDEGAAAGSARATVRANARRFLDEHAAHLWPGAAAQGGGFRWELLCGAGAAVGADRLDSQLCRANVAPAERYVQALPGTGPLRLRAGASGYDNLYLAGDWIDCGLNAGCIEAAVLAGMQAANAIRGRPAADGLLGRWMELGAA
jgi:uncharacterized protein with NAD-binding domain and iron-sulfur cluster